MKSEPDVARWRADTPLCATGRIHLNNAGAGAMPTCVVDAIRAHIDLEAERGGYEAAADMAERIEACYADVGELIGAAPRNVAILEHATVAYEKALSAFDLGPGDVVLTSRNDYISNQLMLLSLRRRFGVEVVHADDLPEGGVDPDSMRTRIERHRPKLVAVTHVPTNSGLIQPVEVVGELCAEREVPYLVDACQSVGQLDVDVQRIRCDFLSATGRKFLRGPRGTGFLYVSDRALAAGREPLYIDMRGARWTDPLEFTPAADAKRFESWEFAYALVLGLSAAARYALDVGRPGRERAIELAAELRRRLAAVGADVLDRGAELAAIVTARVPGVDTERLVRDLDARGVHTSLTLREYAVIDMDDRGVADAVRLSPHYFNTSDELERAVQAVVDVSP